MTLSVLFFTILLQQLYTNMTKQTFLVILSPDLPVPVLSIYPEILCMQQDREKIALNVPNVGLLWTNVLS